MLQTTTTIYSSTSLSTEDTNRAIPYVQKAGYLSHYSDFVAGPMTE